MAKREIHQFLCLSDNYGVLIHDSASRQTASIDAPEAPAIRAALKEKGWQLTHIFTTHHHHDHTGANLELKQETGCTIVGPKGGKIPGIDQEVGEGDIVAFGSTSANVLETPGHTLDHITYVFGEDGVAFAGDTLFTLGCGRVFEGTMEQMWKSLNKLKALPPETVIYCGHEYTLSNAKFALSVDGGNAALAKRAKEIEALRAGGKPTVPTTIAQELATNPFLRAEEASLQKALGMAGKGAAAVFAELRGRKDRF